MEADALAVATLLVLATIYTWIWFEIELFQATSSLSFFLITVIGNRIRAGDDPPAGIRQSSAAHRSPVIPLSGWGHRPSWPCFRFLAITAYQGLFVGFHLVATAGAAYRFLGVRSGWAK